MSETPRYKVYFTLLFSLVIGIQCYSQIDIDPEFVKKELPKALKDRNKGQIINCYTLLGKYYTQKKQYDLGLTYLLKAKLWNPEDSVQYTAYWAGFASLFKDVGAISQSIIYEKKIFNQRSMDLGTYFAASNLGADYLQIYELDSALFYFQEQLKVAEVMQDYVGIASSKNNIGIAFEQGKVYEKALQYFKEAESILKIKKPAKNNFFGAEHNEFEISVSENIGRALYRLGKYAEAINRLEVTTKAINTTLVNENVFALCDSYIKMHYFDKAHAMIDHFMKFEHANKVEDKIRLLRMQIELATAQNQNQLVNRLLKKWSLLMEEMKKNKRLEGNKTSEIVSKYLLHEMGLRIQREKDKQALIKSRLEFANDKSNFVILVSGTLILFMVFGIYLYFQNSKNKKRKLALEYESLQLENAKHALKIRTQEQTLTDYAIDFNKNRERENYFIDKLKKLGKLNPKDVQGELNNAISEIQMRLKIDDKLEDLGNESELIQQEFRDRILAKHPDLTKSDLQLCLLLRLDLGNKEIAAYRNVSTDSVKIYKTRLRTKLQLENADQLVDYLKGI